jgi:hypothetical protein
LTIGKKMAIHPKSHMLPFDQRRDAADKPIMPIPISANPALADLLEWYCTQRIAYCKEFYDNPPPAAI